MDFEESKLMQSMINQEWALKCKHEDFQIKFDLNEGHKLKCVRCENLK